MFQGLQIRAIVEGVPMEFVLHPRTYFVRNVLPSTISTSMFILSAMVGITLQSSDLLFQIWCRWYELGRFKALFAFVRALLCFVVDGFECYDVCGSLFHLIDFVYCI